jgi:hypothetical protein
LRALHAGSRTECLQERLHRPHLVQACKKLSNSGVFHCLT